jgi:hypothetical protein
VTADRTTSTHPCSESGLCVHAEFSPCKTSLATCNGEAGVGWRWTGPVIPLKQHATPLLSSDGTTCTSPASILSQGRQAINPARNGVFHTAVRQCFALMLARSLKLFAHSPTSFLPASAAPLPFCSLLASTCAGEIRRSRRSRSSWLPRSTTPPRTPLLLPTARARSFSHTITCAHPPGAGRTLTMMGIWHTCRVIFLARLVHGRRPTAKEPNLYRYRPVTG